MNYNRLLFLILLFALGSGAEAESCTRIVSLAPSLTETLFELGVGRQIVGVTRYDSYPPEAKSIPRVGGFLDPNFEVIVAMRPTIVFLLAESGALAAELEKLGLNVRRIRQGSIDEILKSLVEIGAACGKSSEAAALSTRLKERMAEIKSQSQLGQKYRALVVVGAEDGDLGKLFLSGSDGFYSSILEISGSENVYRQKTAAMPGVSLEGLYSMDPDFIVHIVYESETGKIDRMKLAGAWDRYSSLRAVQQKRVYILSEDYTHIPGPRFIKLLERFFEIRRGLQQ